MRVDLISPYRKYIRKNQPGGTFIKENDRSTCMTMIDLATGWFDIVEIPTFDLEEVELGNSEKIDKSSARVIQLFNNTWICRYSRPSRVVFDNGSEFKRYFNPLLKDFDIKPVITLVKNPQDNAPVERIHQVILNMHVTKDLDNKVFEYKYPWGETLEYIAWAIRSSYRLTIMATAGQAVFGRDMLFKLASVVDW